MSCLPAPLLARTLERLGVDSAVTADLSGLRTVYAAWCAHVPFDNVRKLTALHGGRPGPLPGIQPVDFVEAWLADGTGGTCWAASEALRAVLGDLGFKALRIAGSMRDLGPLNHGATVVLLDGKRWLVDASLLFGQPVLMGRGLSGHDDPVFGAQVEPTADGAHLLWVQVPPGTDWMPCRLHGQVRDQAFAAAQYEASRGTGVFNQRLYVRRNRPGELALLFGARLFRKTATGTTVDELDEDGIVATLVDLGLSERAVAAWQAAGGMQVNLAAPPPGTPPPVGPPPSLRTPSAG